MLRKWMWLKSAEKGDLFLFDFESDRSEQAQLCIGVHVTNRAEFTISTGQVLKTKLN